MERTDIYKKVKEAFVEVLEHQKFELLDTTTADDVDGWESITHMLIVNEVERSFSIKFKLMDLMNMNSVGDLVNSISKELKN